MSKKDKVNYVEIINAHTTIMDNALIHRSKYSLSAVLESISQDPMIPIDLVDVLELGEDETLPLENHPDVDTLPMYKFYIEGRNELHGKIGDLKGKITKTNYLINSNINNDKNVSKLMRLISKQDRTELKLTHLNAAYNLYTSALARILSLTRGVDFEVTHELLRAGEHSV